MTVQLFIGDVVFQIGTIRNQITATVIMFYFILYSEPQCISKLDKIGIIIDMKFH